MSGRERAGPDARLEESLLNCILAFPARIDAMETRDEQSCRRLAQRLVAIVEAELKRRDRETDPGTGS